jgi:hypothetical protein
MSVAGEPARAPEQASKRPIVASARAATRAPFPLDNAIPWLSTQGRLRHIVPFDESCLANQLTAALSYAPCGCIKDRTYAREPCPSPRADHNPSTGVGSAPEELQCMGL